jgi:bifunctional ADP-heptose synthase (sugar kinase/adenylyltransferase)
VNLVRELDVAVAKDRKRIIVIGDVISDVWINGRVEECQEGCQKLIEESRCNVPGGAENALQCLSVWNVNSSLYGQSGSARPVKYRFTDKNNKIIFRWDSECILSGEGLGSVKWERNLALEMVRHSSGVLLSDYCKGFLSGDFICSVIKLCNERFVPCVVDAKRNPKIYKGAIVKCNVDYAFHWGYTADVRTAGALPPAVRGTSLPLKMPPVNCVNHVGAGDCFAAYLVLALSYGFSLEDSARIAYSAGRVYVQHRYNRSPLPDEVYKDMEGLNQCATNVLSP